MSKAQITIAKPDASRSCHHCRKSGGLTETVWCKPKEKRVPHIEAQTCPDYRDSRQTYQVISASGKVGPA